MNLSYNQRGLDSFDDIYMDDDLPSNFELDPSLNSLAGGILGNNNNDSDALNLNFDDPAISLRDLLVSPSLSTNPRKHVKRDGRDKQREDDNHGAITPEEMELSDSSDASEGDSSIEKKGSDRKGKGRKGNSMEEEVKAKNREHAKNTRLRKRQYIESVKDNIQKILEERDEVDKERKKALAKVAEEMTLRKAVIWEFLQLRALASTDREAWMKLLAKDFTLVLPITPFRSFSPDEISKGQRTIRGIDALLRDQASLKVLTDTLVPPTKRHRRKLEFKVNIQAVIVKNNYLMCRWERVSVNAKECGLRAELYKVGMMKAVFSTDSHKVAHVEEVFDVMSYMQQLRRVMGKPDFMVIPNTWALAQDNKDLRAIVEAQRPHKITFISLAWCYLYGFSEEYCLTNTLDLLVSPTSTDPQTYALLQSHLERGHPWSGVVRSMTYMGQTVETWMCLFPLYGANGEVVHFVAMVECLDPVHAVPHIPPPMQLLHLPRHIMQSHPPPGYRSSNGGAGGGYHSGSAGNTSEVSTHSGTTSTTSSSSGAHIYPVHITSQGTVEYSFTQPKGSRPNLSDVGMAHRLTGSSSNGTTTATPPSIYTASSSSATPSTFSTHNANPSTSSGFSVSNLLSSHQLQLQQQPIPNHPGILQGMTIESINAMNAASNQNNKQQHHQQPASYQGNPSAEINQDKAFNVPASTSGISQAYRKALLRKQLADSLAAVESQRQASSAVPSSTTSSIVRPGIVVSERTKSSSKGKKPSTSHRQPHPAPLIPPSTLAAHPPINKRSPHTPAGHQAHVFIPQHSADVPMPPPPTIDALPQAHAAARKDDSIGGATSGDPPFATSTSGSGGGDAALGNSRKGKGKGKKRETTSTPTGELTPPIAGPARKHNKGKTSPYSSASASALTSSPPVPVQPISSSSRSSNGAPDLRNPMIAGIYEQFRNNLDYSMSSDGVSTSGIGDAQSVSSAANSLYVQDTPHPAVASYRMAMEDHKAFDMDENAFVVDVLLGEERPSPSTSTEEHRP